MSQVTIKATNVNVTPIYVYWFQYDNSWKQFTIRTLNQSNNWVSTGNVGLGDNIPCRFYIEATDALGTDKEFTLKWYDGSSIQETPSTFYNNSSGSISSLPSKKLYCFQPSDYTSCTVGNYNKGVSSGAIDSFEFVQKGDTPTPTPIKYKVTSTLSYCTLTPTDTEIEEGTETTFTVTADSGYQFTVAPTLNGSAMTKTSDTVYTTTITVNADVTINASATAIPTPTEYVTGTYNLTNCTISPSTTQFEKGDRIKFTVTANDGYTFRKDSYTSEKVTIKMGSSQYSFTSESTTVQSITIDLTDDFTITGTANLKPVPRVYLYLNLENCTCNYSNGDAIDTGKEITFTANEGYYFYNVTGTVAYKPYLQNVWGEAEDFGLNGEGTQSPTNTNISFYWAQNYDFRFGYAEDPQTIRAIPIPSEIINGISIYNLTEDKLASIMQARFTKQTDSSGNETIIDFGKWITNLYYLPFDISGIVQNESVNILLGTKNSATKAKLLKSTLEVDLGNITIPEITNSNKSENKYELYLPFINEIISLDTEKIVGKTLSLKYSIDLLEETVTVLGYITGITEPLIFNKYSIGRNLPFFSTESGNTSLKYSNDTRNDFYSAFIIVSGRNTEALISTYSGKFIQVDNINFTTTATESEQNEIKTLLRNGVYINE